MTARWVPVTGVLVRGSYGTGFRAPAMTDIAGTLVFSALPRTRIPARSRVRQVVCREARSTTCWPVQTGLRRTRPEAGDIEAMDSRWALGRHGLLARRRSVEREDQEPGAVARHCGTAGFRESAAILYLFTNPYADPRGFTTIAFSQLPFNGGTAKYRGIDWDVTYRTDTRWGVFTRELDGHPDVEGGIHLGTRRAL